MTEKNNIFPLEKILTVNVETYCKSVGKKVSDYELRGVHADAATNHLIMEYFSKAVPETAEVVVDYTVKVNTNSIKSNYIFGTALIPKNK